MVSDPPPTPSAPRTLTLWPDSVSADARTSDQSRAFTSGAQGVNAAGASVQPRWIRHPGPHGAGSPPTIAVAPTGCSASRTIGTGVSSAPGGEYPSPQQTTPPSRRPHALASGPGLIPT